MCATEAGLDSVGLRAGVAGDCWGGCTARCGAGSVPSEEIVFAMAVAGSVVDFVSALFSCAGFIASVGMASRGFAGLEMFAAVPLDGNRMPQNPGEASVNSSSTYPLALE